MNKDMIGWLDMVLIEVEEGGLAIKAKTIARVSYSLSEECLAVNQTQQSKEQHNFHFEEL